MHIPLNDIIQTRYVKEQIENGLSSIEVFERRMHRLLDSYLLTLKNSYNDIMSVDGTLTIEFNPSSDGLQINMKYDDNKYWKTPEDRDNFNEALADKHRSNANNLRATRQEE